MRRYACEIAMIGAGPAGLAAAHALKAAGRDVLIFEKGAVAHHVAQYPPYMTWFSTADLLEIGGLALTIPGPKPTMAEYLAYLRRFVRERGLAVKIGHEATALSGEDGEFVLSGNTDHGELFEATAQKVVIATGAWDCPQMIGCPGEELPKVSHHYRGVHEYYGSKVLVVGGRNSAAEAALELWRAGVEVSICHRAERFRSLKYWIEPDIENRIKNGEITAYRPANVTAIRQRTVVLEQEGHGTIEIENDFVLALTGYRADPALLERFGVPRREDETPIVDPKTLESERAGVYVVGVVLTGNVSGEIFIENSRTHGERILAHLRQPATAGTRGET